MLSFILIILACAIVYYLYITLQEYFKNPLSAPVPPSPQYPTYAPQESSPYALDPLDRLKNSYVGSSIGMLGRVLEAGIGKNEQDRSTMSLLQQGIIEDFIKALCADMPKQEADVRSLFASYVPSKVLQHTILYEENTNPLATETLDSSTSDSIAKLARVFLDNTYGEYKKRLGFVSFLLLLAWSDRELNDREQDVILDIAAFLEIDNQDFNTLYENFESLKDYTLNQESIATYTKALQTESAQFMQATEDNPKAYQECYLAQIQKICAQARKKDQAPDLTLKKLWECESAYEALTA